MSEESANERFERFADAFYEETGMLSPGKNDALEMDGDMERRITAYRDWSRRVFDAGLTVPALTLRLADAEAERDRLREFAYAVITPCAWGPSASLTDTEEDINYAAERCGIFREVAHAQPCMIEDCGCDGATTLLDFAWSPPTATEASDG